MKNYKKRAFALPILISLLAVSGCRDRPNHQGVASSGDFKFQMICVDGVQYLYRVRGHGKSMTAHFKPDGSLNTCDS